MRPRRAISVNDPLSEQAPRRQRRALCRSVEDVTSTALHLFALHSYAGRGVGLRAECRSLGPARAAADGITELVDPDGPQGPGSHRYDLTGVAGHAEDVSSERGPVGAEFVITTGDQAFVARTAGPGAEVAVSSRVTAQCTFSVVADYEWDAFGLPI
jgi:hypothetical protein